MQNLDLIGEINEKVVAPLIAALDFAKDDITLRIDSPGGEVEAGMRLAIALTRWADANPEKNIIIEVGAMACSMAANLLGLAPERAEIKGYAASCLMFHSCRGFAEGTPSDIIAAAKYMGGVNEAVVAGLAKRTGLAEEVFRPWFKNSEHWLTGKEALEMNIFGGLATGAVAIVPQSLVALYHKAITANLTKGENINMDNEKTCANDDIIEDVKEEVIEEKVEEAAPVEEVIEEKQEEKVEDTVAEGEEEPTVEEIIANLKAEIDTLKEEVEALKATKARLTSGLKLRKDAPKAENEDWVTLMKSIPGNINPREYASRYTALKKAHPAAFKAYMDAHSTIKKLG